LRAYRHAALASGRFAITPIWRARASGSVRSIASWSAMLTDVWSVSKRSHSIA
jgi:hypothetical protein